MGAHSTRYLYINRCQSERIGGVALVYVGTINIFVEIFVYLCVIYSYLSTPAMKKLNTWLLTIVAIITLTTLSSCHTDDPFHYSTTIDGRWELVTVNGIPVTNEYEVDEFRFITSYDSARPNADGGYGYFGYYSYGTWTEDPINWELTSEWGQTYLYIYYYNETWCYEVGLISQSGYDYLYLTDSVNGDALVYRRMRY